MAGEKKRMGRPPVSETRKPAVLLLLESERRLFRRLADAERLSFSKWATLTLLRSAEGRKR